MSNLILTPLQLWDGYDPTKEPLQVSFENYDDCGSYYFIKGHFNAEKCEDGPIRVVFTGRIPKGHCKNVAIVVDDDAISRNLEEMNSLIEIDYGLLFYDYCGEGVNKDYTSYPESLKWANIKQSGDHLKKAIPSARETCGFIWTKILRRMITLAEQLFGDNPNVFLIGHKRGADVVWKAAAMEDKRVKGIVTIFNAGWTEYSNNLLESESDIELNDERERWLTGCATQTYAKFVKCPILFVGASNSNQTPLDRLERTMNQITESSDIKKFVSPGLSCNIDKSAVVLIKEWLKKISGEEILPEVPEFDVEVKNRKVELMLDYKKFHKKPEEVYVYVSYNQTDPRLRNWQTFVLLNGEEKVNIPVYNNTTKIFVYINAKYKEGYCLSSLMKTYDINPEEVDVDYLEKSHIIYEKKMGIDVWKAEQDDRTIATQPKLIPGAYDIMGLGCDRGDISIYTIGETSRLGESGNLLQFACYCEEDRTLTIKLMAYEDNQLVEYSGELDLHGSNEWQKISLELTFFKTEDVVPLKTWESARKLTFVDVKGILLNNILWV